jgi:hypothetical protein
MRYSKVKFCNQIIKPKQQIKTKKKKMICFVEKDLETFEIFFDLRFGLQYMYLASIRLNHEKNFSLCLFPYGFLFLFHFFSVWQICMRKYFFMWTRIF